MEIIDINDIIYNNFVKSSMDYIILTMSDPPQYSITFSLLTKNVVR